MKIKILETQDIEFAPNKRCQNNVSRITSRNKRAFYPYIGLKNEFKEHGIDFVDDKRQADCYFVGWGSVCNMGLEYEQSVASGVEFLKSLDKPFYFFDTNDSVMLHGIFDVFKQCPGLKYFKSHYYRDLSLYTKPTSFGRYWWPLVPELEYKLSNDDLELLKSKIELSNTNWIYHRKPYNPINVDIINYKYDAICLVGILNIDSTMDRPSMFNYKKEIGKYYNDHRLNIFKKLKNLEKYNFKILTSEQSGKLDEDSYERICLESKIMISPHGFGEINSRELDAINYGNVICKGDIRHIITKPDLFHDDSCIFYKDDLSDFEEKLVDGIQNFNNHKIKIKNIRNRMDYALNMFITDTFRSISDKRFFTSKDIFYNIKKKT
jgi:hypothetical protein